jgi:excisionase family DNA binding protein
MTAALSPLLTIASTAELLNMSERQVHRLIKAKKLKVIRFGRSVRISPAELQRLIDKMSGDD